MTILIKGQAIYLSKPLKFMASAAWNEFFRVSPEETDLAHWMIQADSATVRLTPRNTCVDERSEDWEPPEPIHIRVSGVIELLNAAESSSAREEVRYGFREWAIAGILSAFKSKRIAKQFGQSRFGSRGFAIVSSPTDAGLGEDDLSVVWTNDEDFTVARIKARQKKAHSGTRNCSVKRKRRSATKIKTKRARK